MNQNKSISFYQNIMNRRIPHFLGFYAVAGWTLLQFVDWIVNRYILSPYLVDFSLALILSMIPSVIILAYFHGSPGKDTWGRIEKIGIPCNVLLSIIILFVVFYPKDLGAATKTIIVETEDGKRMKRIIPKSEFIKSFISLLLNFTKKK